MIHNELMGKKIGVLRICVMTGYRAQVALIKDQLPEVENLRVVTFDAMQGGEAEFIIVSLVRSAGQTVGFLEDTRRQCVFLSRSKVAHIMVGTVPHLYKAHPSFRAMVNWYSKHRAIYIGSDTPIKEYVSRQYGPST